MSTPPLNPISFRLMFGIGEEDVDPAVATALRYAFSGNVDLNQAIAALNAKVNANHKTAMAAAGSSSSSTTIINSNNFPYLGTVNDQRGNVAYLTELTDNGAKIVLGDSSPITVTLNALVLPPWFTFIDNDSSSLATLTPSSGFLFGEPVIPGNGFGIVFFDGVNFFCGATRIATDSSLGYVQPDDVTIDVDTSGIISTIGATGTIPLGPLTDSGATGSIQVQKGLIISWVSPT